MIASGVLVSGRAVEFRGASVVALALAMSAPYFAAKVSSHMTVQRPESIVIPSNGNC